MSAIINYVLNMFPYMIIVTPIYLIVRYIILRKNKIVNWYHEIGLFIFTIFVVGLASQTIIPKIEIGISGNLEIINTRIHGTNLIPFKVLAETYVEVFNYGNINYFIINFLGNIIMFMPIGLFIPLLWNASSKKVIIIGFCSSLFIEFCQLFLSRGTDVDDLILNTLGVFLGLLVYRFFYKKIKSLISKFRANYL